MTTSAMDLWRIARHQLPALGRDAWHSVMVQRRARRSSERGDIAVALDDYADLLRDSGFARESLATYRAVERVLRVAPAGMPQPPPARLPERLVLFVGYSRSGHSLVGSLLDAHPDAAISHELHLLKHLAAGAPLEAACRALVLNAWLFHRGGRSYTGYDYAVPGQHQGSYRRLLVAGDKKGNGTLRMLRRRPELIDRLPELAPVPLTLIHVIRNPYDNVATRARRKHVSLEHAARGYFANAEMMDRLKARYRDAVVDVYLDDLIARPTATLSTLLQRLELQPQPDYLAACASRVFERPRPTRFDACWSDSVLAAMDRQIRRHAFLARYAGRGSDVAAAHAA